MSDEWEIERISDDEYRVRRVVAGSGSGALGILVFGYIVKGFVEWIAENWVYIVSVIGITVACVIVCVIIANKSIRKTGAKIAATIIISLLLIVGVFTILPSFLGKQSHAAQNLEYYDRHVSMYVNAASGLNLRRSTDTSSDSNIIIVMPLNAEVKVLDDASNWYYVEYTTKYNTYTGYVNSKYLRY